LFWYLQSNGILKEEKEKQRFAILSASSGLQERKKSFIKEKHFFGLFTHCCLMGFFVWLCLHHTAF
jgi:hypothetical protein